MDRISDKPQGQTRDAARRSSPAPLVSVVIPTFNRAALVGEAVASALGQAYPAIEVLVVDDGSTDGTERALQPYRDRIVYLRKANGGISAARNAGMRAARGKFIAWLDDDDVWCRDKTAIQVEVLQAHPEVVMVSTDFSAFDAHGEIEASHIRSYYAAARRSPAGLAALYPQAGWLEVSGTEIRVFHGAVYEALVWGNFVHPPTVMFRRTLLEHIGGLDEGWSNASNAMEHDFFLRASRRGDFAYVDRPLIRYRYHAYGQASSDANRVGAKLGSIELLGRIQRQDPSLARKHRSRFRRRVGECYLGVARGYAQSAPGAALRYLAHSLLRGVVRVESAKVLAKLALPTSLVEAVRRQPRGRASLTSDRLEGAHRNG